MFLEYESEQVTRSIALSSLAVCGGKAPEGSALHEQEKHNLQILIGHQVCSHEGKVEIGLCLLTRVFISMHLMQLKT